MTSPLQSRAFRRLFSAQICSLIGVGLLTVALSLSAYEIGGVAAGGQMLGMLLALKMVAYVVFAPLAETLLKSLPRKRALVMLDVGRMLLLVPMGFVGDTWALAGLAFVFYLLSAGFTPLYQSVIPDVLPEEKTYSKALAWSRVAYTLETILSPLMAALLLTVARGDALYFAAALAFSGSVLALLMAVLPVRDGPQDTGTFLRRAGKGLRIYARTPRLRGLFLVNFALSLAMAWVLVNTVVFAGKALGDAERFFPILMAFFGCGAAVGAVAVPTLLQRISARWVMLSGAYGFALAGIGLALLSPEDLMVLALFWGVFGATSSCVLTPGGLVITRSAHAEDRAAVFAAQFSVSHAGWLVAYPLAGWLGSALTLETALLVLSGSCIGVAVLAMLVWPAQDPLARAHSHPDLPPNHPHLVEVPARGANHRHVHPFHIDDLHPYWQHRSF